MTAAIDNLISEDMEHEPLGSQMRFCMNFMGGTYITLSSNLLHALAFILTKPEL